MKRFFNVAMPLLLFVSLCGYGSYQAHSQSCEPITPQLYIEPSVMFPLNFTTTAPVSKLDIAVGLGDKIWKVCFVTGAEIMYYPPESLNGWNTAITRIPFMGQARFEYNDVTMKMGIGVATDSYDWDGEFIMNAGIGIRRGDIGVQFLYEFARAPSREITPQFYSFVGFGIVLHIR